IPILDGLDEMPQPQRQAALDAIRRDTAGEPFVLTCRLQEFAATRAEQTLHDAVVVRLLPLERDAAANYLLDASSGAGLDRWDPVISRLTDDSDAPIVVALTKPLTLFLVQTVYQNPDTDPAELLDRERFADAGEIEARLLDAFVLTAFDTRP